MSVGGTGVGPEAGHPARVLVTGASGFIGSHLVARLVDAGVAVRTLGRRAPPRARGRLVEHVTRDVREDFAAAAAGCGCVVHLAGLSDASASDDRAAEYASVNVVGTVRALDAARRAGAAFILASSQRVYRPAFRPVAEEALREPVDPYGLTKLQAEEWTEHYVHRYGLSATILRLFSVYGPGPAGGNQGGVVAIFLRAAREGEPLRVRARQLRDFVDVRDVARAIDLAIQRRPEGLRVCNVGTGRATSIAELGEAVRRVVGSTRPMIVDLSPGAESYVADPRRAAADLGFEAQIDLEQGLVWYNQHLTGG